MINLIAMLMILAFFSIFFGYITKDMYIGLGSGLFSDNALFIHPIHEIMLDTEFGVVTVFKLLPFLFTISLIVVTMVLSEYLPTILVYFKFSRVGYNLFSFFNLRFFIELFYNRYITGVTLELGGQTTKIIDNGSVEYLGPDGLHKGISNMSNNTDNLSTGVTPSYALYILTGFIFYLIVSLDNNPFIGVVIFVILSVLPLTSKVSYYFIPNSFKSEFLNSSGQLFISYCKNIVDLLSRYSFTITTYLVRVIDLLQLENPPKPHSFVNCNLQSNPIPLKAKSVSLPVSPITFSRASSPIQTQSAPSSGNYLNRSPYPIESHSACLSSTTSASGIYKTYLQSKSAPTSPTGVYESVLRLQSKSAPTSPTGVYESVLRLQTQSPTSSSTEFYESTSPLETQSAPTSPNYMHKNTFTLQTQSAPTSPSYMDRNTFSLQTNRFTLNSSPFSTNSNTEPYDTDRPALQIDSSNPLPYPIGLPGYESNRVPFHSQFTPFPNSSRSVSLPINSPPVSLDTQITMDAHIKDEIKLYFGYVWNEGVDYMIKFKNVGIPWFTRMDADEQIIGLENREKLLTSKIKNLHDKHAETLSICSCEERIANTMRITDEGVRRLMECNNHLVSNMDISLEPHNYLYIIPKMNFIPIMFIDCPITLIISTGWKMYSDPLLKQVLNEIFVYYWDKFKFSYIFRLIVIKSLMVISVFKQAAVDCYMYLGEKLRALSDYLGEKIRALVNYLAEKIRALFNYLSEKIRVLFDYIRLKQKG